MSDFKLLLRLTNSQMMAVDQLTMAEKVFKMESRPIISLPNNAICVKIGHTLYYNRYFDFSLMVDLSRKQINIWPIISSQH